MANPSRTFSQVKVGAEQSDLYLPLLKNKRVAVVCNQTSMVNNIHLVDYLLKNGVSVKKVFAPEHGFRGDASAGAHIDNSMDATTKLPIISLYGKKYKPTPIEIADVDVLLFDIQDVGCRFYTYISTLHYCMESAAENKKQIIVLDRPNPNGNYVDGPVLELAFKSFVGMHPIPVVYGLTMGEYAQMINGEKWLNGKLQANLKVIYCKNYTHNTPYILPIPPSPNLPNHESILLYPSLCFFEGTPVSVGRGTHKPFQIFGYPDFKEGSFEFTPISIKGKAENPPFLNKVCKGVDLSKFAIDFIPNHKKLYLYWLIGAYQTYPDKTKFFNAFFDKLAGNATLKQQIIKGLTEEEIRKSWQPDLDKYKKIRSKYLYYPE